MLNSSLDLKALSQDFQKQRRIRIHDVLRPEIADELVGALERERGWKLLCANLRGAAALDPAQIAALPPNEQRVFHDELMTAARRGVGFSYLGLRLKELWGEQGAPDTPLGCFYSALSSRPILDAVEEITGESGLVGASPQASCFGPGHYLTRHLDDPAGEQRRYAFVWGFTRNWHPDWGGLLLFFERNGAPTQAFSPGFNTLDLFEVSHIHSVTQVAHFAGANRLAVSGWFTNG